MSRDRGGHLGVGEAERRSPLPLRATGIVLLAWVVALMFIAFVIVPLIFATCFPTTAPPA